MNTGDKLLLIYMTKVSAGRDEITHCLLDFLGFGKAMLLSTRPDQRIADKHIEDATRVIRH